MITQPLADAIKATRGVLANVQADQLSSQSPCASWDVAGLIDHIVGGQSFFKSGLLGEPPVEAEEKPSAGDYLAQYDTATDACLAAFSADGALDGIVSMPFGDMPGMAFMGLAVNDTLTHGWDLAKATGQSTDIAPELSAMVLQQAQQSIHDSFRGDEGAPFGPAKEAPAGATNADKLAAFLGRDV